MLLSSCYLSLCHFSHFLLPLLTLFVLQSIPVLLCFPLLLNTFLNTFVRPPSLLVTSLLFSVQLSHPAPLAAFLSSSAVFAQSSGNWLAPPPISSPITSLKFFLLPLSSASIIQRHSTNSTKLLINRNYLLFLN